MNLQKRSSIPLTDYMFHKAGIGKIPLSGTFELTPLCNFACRMCYVRKTAEDVKNSPRPMLTLNQWMKIAEETYEAGTLYLLLTGGEPTLLPEFWKFYEKLVQMGFLVSINTNGSRLDAQAIELLKALPPRRINITLYGANDTTYERLCGVSGVFSKVEKAICLLKNAGIQVKLNCSLTPYNVCDLEQIIRFARDQELILDIASYMFPPIRRDISMIGKNERFTPQEAAWYRMKAYHLQNGDEKYREFLQSILQGSVVPPGLDENCMDPVDGQIRCRAGKASYWITWDGWMMTCGMMNSPKVETRDRPLVEAWNELTTVSSKLALSGICSKCPNLTLCHSCAAMAQTETGDISGIPTYLCEVVQEMKRIAKEEMTGFR